MRAFNPWCFLLLLLLPAAVFGQQARKLAEIENWLKTAPKDSLFVDKLNYIGNDYALSGKKDALPLANQAFQLSDSLGYDRGKGIAHLNLAIIHDIRGKYHAALEHYLLGMRVLKKVKDEDHLSQLLQNLGYFYYTQGNYRKAIEVTKQAADLTFKNYGESGSTYCWGNLGLYYAEAAEYDSALFYTLQAYEVLKVEKDTAGLADTFYNLGNIAWKADKNARKALNYAHQALEFYIAKPVEAEAYIECKSFIGEMYLQLGNHAMAGHYLQESLKEAQQHQYRFLIKNIYKAQAELYSRMRLWDKAYESHRLFFQLHDSIFNEHSANRVDQLKAEYELETREAKIELLNKNKVIQADELKQQMLMRNSSLVLLLLFMFAAAVLYRNNTAKKRANQLLVEQKRQIEEQHAAILLKNKQLEEQKYTLVSQAQNLNQATYKISSQQQTIEQTTQDLTSSLHYASRIQSAMMPHPEELKAALPDSFIWLNAKEIVSGDFYWFAHVHNKVYLAAIDCTGQGVPGAFMSLIGDVYLNQTILHEEVHQADQILNRLHEHVRRTLNQETSYSQEGMEVGICVIDLQAREVQFAGARNNLYYTTGETVTKVSGDRMLVGSLSIDKHFPGYTAHQIKLTGPTSFYMSTDGVRDQFGGAKDKKFGEKRFLELISSICQLSMQEQQEKLQHHLQAWMQGYEQTDDIMVIGWKL